MGVGCGYSSNFMVVWKHIRVLLYSLYMFIIVVIRADSSNFMVWKHIRVLLYSSYMFTIVVIRAVPSYYKQGPLLRENFCLGVGAWLKVNTRALGRGAL